MSAPDRKDGPWPSAYLRFGDGPVLMVVRRGDQIFAGGLDNGHPATFTEFSLDELSEFTEALRGLQEPAGDAVFYEIRTLIRVTDSDGEPADRFTAAETILRALTGEGFVAATVQLGEYQPLRGQEP